MNGVRVVKLGIGSAILAAIIGGAYISRNVWLPWLRPASPEAHTGTDSASNAGKEGGDTPGKLREFSLTPEAISKYGVKIDQATTQTLLPTFVVPGEVSFNSERIAHVGAVLTGRVAELKVRVGQKVTKGDDLLVIDSSELGAAQSDHLQRRIAVQVATSAANLAKNAYDRLKALHDESQVVTLSELQKREGEYKAAEGGLQTAASNVAASLSRLQLLGMDDEAVKKLESRGRINPKYVIHSPISGQIMECMLTMGELVRPEKESLITVADLTTIWVLADVPEFRLKGLKLGAVARVRMAEGVAPLQGPISYIPPQLDSSTRTARVRIDVKNDGDMLRAGAFTQVEFADEKLGSSDDSVVVIPEDAVQNIDGSPSIFIPVTGKDCTFICKTIATGPSAGGMVAVEAGLKAGQPYVCSGTFTLKAEFKKSSIEE